MTTVNIKIPQLQAPSLHGRRRERGEGFALFMQFTLLMLDVLTIKSRQREIFTHAQYAAIVALV
jgi:hypothetical protein